MDTYFAVYGTLHCIAVYDVTGVQSMNTNMPGRARPPGRKFWEKNLQETGKDAGCEVRIWLYGHANQKT